MAKFQMTELLNDDPYVTARLGAGTGVANNIDSKEVGKAVKQIADSQYDLCVVGDPIEGFIRAVESATLDGYSVGSVQTCERMTVMAEGSQAAGTGAIAVGDFVVAGTPVAKGTTLGTAYPKVRKATNQPGAAVTVPDNLQASINTALAALTDQVKNSKFAWRVISIISGTGAVGDTLVIERVNAS